MLNPNEAPEGYVAFLDKDYGCIGCAFSDDENCHDRNCCDRDREDGYDVKFEKIDNTNATEVQAENTVQSIIPTDAAARKECPVYSGVINYFPDALYAVAKQSWLGNEQHNPGSELHWDRSKSGDELDALQRHLVEGDWEAVAWRALANLQKQIEGGYKPNGFRSDV